MSYWKTGLLWDFHANVYNFIYKDSRRFHIVSRETNKVIAQFKPKGFA